MCGIAGILTAPHARPANSEELRRMVALLRHRGPDGWGVFRRGAVALGHTRLAIVGLSDGHQPMATEDGSLWVSGNGEIFNHLELRRELEAKGHRFRTGCDIEAILHAYAEWGADAWRRFNGQFAFALWDEAKRRLWLVRDQAGILPLQWARTGEAVVFASEAKALFAGGRIAPRFDPAGLTQAFTRWAATAPATVFAGVKAVRPGTALRIDADLSVTEMAYWRPDIRPTRALGLDEAAEALGEALTRAVALRLRADVPVSAYVSGGLDSSVITALASQVHPLPLDSFSVRFNDPRFDETAEQRLVARRHETNHHEILVDDGAIGGALPEVVWHCEAPLLRTAPVPLFLLSGLVRQSGRKVVLTGEGADELLAGYDIFKEDRIRRFWARDPDSRLRPLLLGRLYADVGEGAKADAVWRRFFRAELGGDHPFQAHRLRWRNTGWSLRFLSPALRHAVTPELLDDVLEMRMPPGWHAWTPLARAQAVECETFLAAWLLSCQGDRVAMAHGVEARYPFLDPEVMALCHALPDRVKLLGLRDKLALRRFARHRLPPGITNRPKKPYRAPMAPALFSAPARDWTDALLSPEALARFDVVDPVPAGALIAKARERGGRMAGEREEMALVGLASLQLLAHAVTEDFPARLRAARSALAAVPPSVRVEP